MSAACYQAWSQQLSETSRERAKHYHSHARRNQFVAGRQLLASLATHSFNEPITISTLSTGRPIVINSSGQTFPCSLSHSGNWLVAAFYAPGEIGVDVELTKPGRNVDAAIKHFFSDRAWNILKNRTAREREVWFYQQWCAREAIIKCIGEGSILDVLASPLENLGSFYSHQAVFVRNVKKPRPLGFLDVRWREAPNTLGDASNEDATNTSKPVFYRGEITNKKQITLIETSNEIIPMELQRQP